MLLACECGLSGIILPAALDRLIMSAHPVDTQGLERFAEQIAEPFLLPQLIVIISSLINWIFHL